MSGVPVPIRRALIPLLLVAIAGCDGDQQEIAQLARQQLEQQAAQNDAVLRQSQQLTEAAQELVEADAQARREIVQLQEQLQSDSARERQSLDRQRDELEAERRQLARARHREPILAAAILHAGLLLLAAMPLVICALLFRAAEREPPDAAVGELLIQEFVADEPLLLPGPPRPALEHRPDAASNQAPGPGSESTDVPRI